MSSCSIVTCLTIFLHALVDALGAFRIGPIGRRKSLARRLFASLLALWKTYIILTVCLAPEAAKDGVVLGSSRSRGGGDENDNKGDDEGAHLGSWLEGRGARRKLEVLEEQVACEAKLRLWQPR